MAKAKAEVPSSILDNIVVIAKEVAEKTSPKEEVKLPVEYSKARIPTDPDWTDYVISQLGEGEVYQGVKGGKTALHPTVPGLRRFVDSNFELISSESHSTSTIYTGNGNMPTVTVDHHLEVVPKKGFPTRTSGVACAGPHNLEPNFPYPAECAETRAEGRAYVKLLRLKVCTKEEVSDTNLKEFVLTSTISLVQIKQLEAACKPLNINLLKLLNIGDVKCNTPEEFPVAKFKPVFKFLNELQQGQYNNNLSDVNKELLKKISN